jgi:anti-sigma factor RsiW
MDCREARTLLLDRARSTLAGEQRAPLDAHLAGCAECRHEASADAELSTALATRLARRRAPEALRRSVEAEWDASASAPRPAGVSRSRRVLRTTLAMVAGAALALLVMLVWRGHGAEQAMVTEAVNDHLRVLYGEHPLEVESGGIHQVKPWFEGRVDFAPVVPFAGDDDYPLQGGAVAYFLDRKAATFVFKRRLHVMTLFVFPAEGLPWPALATHPFGGTHGNLATTRGIHVLLWRKGDLGYALVSDVDVHDIDALATRVVGGATGP